MQELLLLHGAIGSMDQFIDLDRSLQESFIVHSINFNGHGDSPMNSKPFSIELFADEVLLFLNKHEIETIHIFGYSMGGYIAMYLANQHPHRINKIITLGTKFKWDEATATKENQMLQPEKIEELLPAFASSLQKRHAPNDWKIVLKKTADMLTNMGKSNPVKLNDFKTIHHQILLMLGDRDKMVTMDETLQIYKSLPHAQLAILPNTQHPIELANIDRLVNEIKTFLP